MRRATFLLLGLLAAPLIAACGWDPGPFPETPADDPFADAALAERVERLIPDVEAVLGRSLGPIEVVVADRTEWTDRFAASVLRRAAPEPESAIAVWNIARVTAQFSVALTVQASVFEDGADRIWVIPESLDDIDTLLRSDVLDLVLAHEMAHVAQNRFLGMRYDLAEELGDEAALARRAVHEGHAQWVMRRVVARRGTELARAAWWAATFEGAPPFDDPAFRQAFLAEQATGTFTYGRGEDFVAAVIDALGYDEALRRLVEAPPSTAGEVLEPARWLAGESRGNHAADPNDVLLFVGGSPDDTTTLLPPLLALRLGDGDPTALLEGVVAASTTPIGIAHGTLWGTQGLATAIRCADAQAAETVASALSSTLLLPRRTAPVAAPAPEVLDASSSVEPWGTHLRLRVRGLDEATSTEAQVLVIRSGPYVVEVGLSARHLETDGARRLGAQVANLLDAESPCATAWADREGAAKHPVAWWRKARERALEDADLRTGLLRALATTGWYRYADDEERAALERDPDAEVRASFLALLAEEHESEVAAATLERILAPDHAGPHHVAADLAAPFAKTHEAVARALLGLLANADGRVRRRALAALVLADREGMVPEDALATLRTDAESDTRLIALQASVPRARQQEASARGLLLEATRDASAQVRSLAWRLLLMDLDPFDPLPVSAVRRGLSDPVPAVRAAVAMTLGLHATFESTWTMGRSKETAFEPYELARLVRKGLHDEDANAQGAALMLASGLGDRSRSLLPDIARLLDHPVLRSLAAQALGGLGEHAVRAVPALGRLLVRRVGRQDAAAALEQIGPPAHEAVPALRAALDLPHDGTRLAAARALHAIQGESPEAVATACDVLAATEVAGVRAAALEALASMETATPEVQASVRPHLCDSEWSIRVGALGVLEHADTLEPATHMAAAALWLDEEELVRMTVQDVIDLRDGLPPEVVSALGERLGDLDLEVRGEAARELAQAGALGSTPVAPLVVGLSSPLTWVRWACADSLWTLCRHARPALPALRRALGDPNDEVVECALGAIEEIGTDLGPEVVLALARLAVDPDSSNAYEAQNVLGDLGAEATVAVSFLLDALAEDQPYERRRRACLALTDIGPPAAEALPRLRGLAAEPQTRTYHLPYRARQAIESIEGAGAE